MVPLSLDPSRPAGSAGRGGGDLILFGHRSSGHSYKVAMALSLAGRRYQYRDVDPAVAQDARPRDFQALSSFGEIPVLVDNATVLVQSNAILLHLAAAAAPRVGGNLELLQRWLFWEANRIGFSLPNLRVARSDQAAGTGLVDWLERRLMADLAILERELARQPWLAGEAVSVADLSCAAYLLLEDRPLDLSAWSAIRAWLERIRSLPGWQLAAELMPMVPNDTGPVFGMLDAQRFLIDE